MMYERRMINAVIDRDLDFFAHPRFVSPLLLHYPIPVIVVGLYVGNPHCILKYLAQVPYTSNFFDQSLHL